jgi:hypothetical protein
MDTVEKLYRTTMKVLEVVGGPIAARLSSDLDGPLKRRIIRNWAPGDYVVAEGRYLGRVFEGPYVPHHNREMIKVGDQLLHVARYDFERPTGQSTTDEIG